jgi:ABC-type branched-subunit amino acid transport system ATPase component
MIATYPDLQRPVADVTVVFGPDGAGKTHAVNMWADQGSTFVRLRGAEPWQWFKDYPDELKLFGFSEDDIPFKWETLPTIALVNKVALKLGNSGLSVVVDGHPAHKAAINLASRTRAGECVAKDGLRLATIKRQVDHSALSPHFSELKPTADLSVVHVEVNMSPGRSAAQGAKELQTRIGRRRTRWDSADTSESAAQILQSRKLAATLQRNGAAVLSVMTHPDSIERVQRLKS